LVISGPAAESVTENLKRRTAVFFEKLAAFCLYSCHRRGRAMLFFQKIRFLSERIYGELFFA